MDKLSYCGSFLATPLSLEGVAGRKRRLFRAQRTGYGTKIGTTTATFLCIFDPCMFGRTCPSFPAVSAPLSGNNKNSPSAILARACKKSDIHAVHDRRVGMPANQATGFDRNKITPPNFNDPQLWLVFLTSFRLLHNSNITSKYNPTHTDRHRVPFVPCMGRDTLRGIPTIGRWKV